MSSIKSENFPNNNNALRPNTHVGNTYTSLSHYSLKLAVVDDGENISLMDGKLHVYRRPGSRYWQCSTYLGQRNHRATTKETSLLLAREFAKEWYMERYAEDRRRRRGEPLLPQGDLGAARPDPNDRRRRPVASGPTFRQAVTEYKKEIAVLTEGERNPAYVKNIDTHLNLHLIPFFGDKAVAEISSGMATEYRAHRMTSKKHPKTDEPIRPSRSTLHKEMVVLRQVLKTACRKAWISAVPDLSAPYKSSGKIKHRGWFSPDEYKKLYEATRERAKNPKNERYRADCERFHDYVLFMVNTGLRPDEASRLQYRDVSIVIDADTKQRILEIEVRGKRGVGYCKSTAGAVLPFERLRKRASPQPTDLVFGKVQHVLLNNILNELGLKKDRDGNSRTAYSFRHTYICLRLMEGADIYQIAKNCRTSVEMIETFYASHLKNTLDAGAINVRKRQRTRPAEPSEPPPS